MDSLSEYKRNENQHEYKLSNSKEDKAIQKGHYAVNFLDKEKKKGSYVEHLTQDDQYRITICTLPVVAEDKKRADDGIPHIDYLRFADAQCVAFVAANGKEKPIYIRAGNDPVLVEAYMLVCAAREFKFENESGYKYQNKQNDILQVRGKIGKLAKIDRATLKKNNVVNDKENKADENKADSDKSLADELENILRSLKALGNEEEKSTNFALLRQATNLITKIESDVDLLEKEKSEVAEMLPKLEKLYNEMHKKLEKGDANVLVHSPSLSLRSHSGSSGSSGSSSG